MAAPRTVSIGRQTNGDRAHVTASTAASYARLLAAGMPRGGLTSTTRDWNTQARWHREWKAGRRKAYAAPPALSSHCKGTAVDYGGSQSSWLARHGAAHGWRRTNRAESWHWVHFPNLDRQARAVRRVPAQVRAGFITLRPGLRGRRVSRLQRELRRVFPDYARTVGVDGVYGPHTERAVREFQQRSGLRVDGRVGPVTASAMRAAGLKL